MKRFHQVTFRKAVIFTMFALMALVSTAQAETMATFTEIKGEVRLLSRTRADGKWLRVTQTGVGLYNGDRIRTVDGSATVSFPDGSVIKVSENSDLTIEERPTRRKLFGFVDISFVNRNVKIAFGKLWANVKHSQGKWTSFESKSAVAGIKGTTVWLEVDSNGDMKFRCDEGFSEITRNKDNSVTVRLESGKEVRFKTVGENGEKTLIQAVTGDIDVVTQDGTKISMDEKTSVVVGATSTQTTVEASSEQGSGGNVIVTSGPATLTLNDGDGVSLTSNKVTGGTGIAVISGEIEASIGESTLIMNQNKDGIGDIVNVQTKDGTAEITVVTGQVTVDGNVLDAGGSTTTTVSGGGTSGAGGGGQTGTVVCNDVTAIVSPADGSSPYEVTQTVCE